MKLRPFFGLFQTCLFDKKEQCTYSWTGEEWEVHLQNIPENKHQQFNSTEGSKQSRLSQIQRPSHGPSPLPTPSQKQKHVTSGSICLTPPAVRKAASPQEPPSATSSSEVLQRRSTHSHKAHSATGLNTRKWEVKYFYWKWKKKSTIFKEHLTDTVQQEEHCVTYMGTYRVELYKASHLTGHLASDRCLSYTQWKYRIESISVSRVRSSTSSWQHLIG